MPEYKVMKPGFLAGNLKKPGDIVTTEKPLKPVPSWLKAVQTQKKK